MHDAPAKRRHWLRFSLRMLLVVITVLCVWLGFKVNAARRQKEAVAAIFRDGGSVVFDYQMVPIAGEPDLFDVDANALPSGQAWLRQLFGDDYFRNVVLVVFLGGSIPQSEFEQIGKLHELRSVTLCQTRIRADGSAAQRAIQDTTWSCSNNSDNCEN